LLLPRRIEEARFVTQIDAADHRIVHGGLQAWSFLETLPDVVEFFDDRCGTAIESKRPWR
jgi:hypothetical protein